MLLYRTVLSLVTRWPPKPAGRIPDHNFYDLPRGRIAVGQEHSKGSNPSFPLTGPVTEFLFIPHQ